LEEGPAYTFRNLDDSTKAHFSRTDENLGGKIAIKLSISSQRSPVSVVLSTTPWSKIIIMAHRITATAAATDK
jgi:hypothetical protein